LETLFNRSHAALPGLAAAAFALMLFVPSAHAMKMVRQNLTQLISTSESILAGSVKSVNDGIDDKGIPYTEVTISVGASVKGKANAGEDYTFRQFGLLKPRKLANGHTLLAVSPEGFARWQAGESVVAFMYKPASQTGLQTTAGMSQGKLTSMNGQLTNEFKNAGLFEDVQINSALLTSEEREMLKSHGAVDAATFMGLIDRAVSENWIATGDMQ